MRFKSTKGLVNTIGLLVLAGAFALPAAAQQACPPACGLDVELPEDISEPPRIPAEQEEVRAIRGAVMLATLTARGGAPDKAATKLVFPKARQGEVGEPHTPFVDRLGPNGRPITEVRLRLNGPTVLFVRTDDAHNCFEERACKYDVVNDGEPERPILDPWIIIER